MVVPWPSLTSQTDCGVPGSWFSHAIGLAQAAWAGAAGESTSSAPARASATETAARRSHLRRGLGSARLLVVR